MTTKDEALKLALEALDGLSEPYDVLKAQEAIKEALAQPEQEPVAWRWRERINSDFDSWVISASEPPPYSIEQQPLYTTPPQRKPLTDEEIEKIWWETKPYFDKHDFTRAIEAAHGIKE